MRQEVEFSYDIEPTDGSSHEDFSLKIREYIWDKFGPCEVVEVLNNLGKNGELKPGCEHNYSFVMKFDTNSLANQLKQKFQGITLFKVCFFTSWWPRKQHPLATDDSVAKPPRGRGRGRGRWPIRGGRFASWRGAKFGLATAHYRGGRGTRRPFSAGFTSSRGHNMFRRSDFRNQESTFGEHSSQKAEQESPPTSSSSRSTRRRKVSTVESSSSSSPKRVRRVSMASSTSESNSENGGSEKGHSSESSSVDSYPRITSPIRVDTESPKEEKKEGRVLRSHSSQQASKRRKQTQAKSKSTTPVSTQPTSSRYNTRSKKRVLEEKQTPSPKRRQTSRTKASTTETDDSNYGKRPALGLRKKEQVRSTVALERVVTIVDSDSSSSKCLQLGKVSGGTGESSQSEEEVWVEREVNLKAEAKETVEMASKVASTSDTSTPEEASEECIDIKAVPVKTSEPHDASRTITGASSSTAVTIDAQDTVESTGAMETGSQSVNYTCDRDLALAMMSPHEERDETPPAELLEATMMQGEYSEWYQKSFQNDPEAWQRYMVEYYNAMMMAGGDLQASTGEGEVASQPVTVSAAAADEVLDATIEGRAHASCIKGIASPSLQRTRSLPPPDCMYSTSEHFSNSRDRSCKSLPPDWTQIETNDKFEQVQMEGTTEDSIPEFVGGVLPLNSPSSADDRGLSVSLHIDSGVHVGSQTLAEPGQERIEVKRQIIPVRRKISRKHAHLQKQALRKFLQNAKPLILNTDLLIRHSPSSEDVLMSALETSLENISNDLVGELYDKIDGSNATTTSPNIATTISNVSQ